MPTITIDSPALAPARRRAIAVRLTRWMKTRGIHPSHVVVHFRETPENSIFSGGMPLEALPRGENSPPHASVTCCVGPDRDEEFCGQLAEEIGDALGVSEGSPFLYIEFRPTSPSRVYVARDSRLHRADRPLPTAPVPFPSPAPVHDGVR